MMKTLSVLSLINPLTVVALTIINPAELLMTRMLARCKTDMEPK